MSKAWKITFIIVACILIVFFAVAGVYYFWPWNRDFFKNAVKEFEIPGLDTTFVPQGMDKIDNYEKYIISGYMSDGSPSRYYIYDKANNEIEKYFTIKYGSGMYCGHAGGVASAGMTIWTVGDGECIRLSLNDVLGAEDGGVVDALDAFTTNNGADFVFDHKGMLWIGEFYREKSHTTSINHKIITPSGEEHYSMVYGYVIDESMPRGLLKNVPSKLLSIRDLCQGIEIDARGNIVLSCSYSLPDSNIYYYKDVLNRDEDQMYILGKYSIPMWILDSDDLISSTNAPSMTEDIFIENDRVYILFESNCKKYRLINRKRLSNVYSLPISCLK